MAKYININVAAKVFINFTPVNISFIREEANSKPITISYSAGLGQTLASGTIVNSGTVGQPNFTQLTFPTGATFTGSGTVNAIISATPGATVPDQTVTFQIDGSNFEVNIDYNSRPTMSDINLSIAFTQERPFTLTDFTSTGQGNYQDFDSDALAEVMVEGNLTDYFYPNAATPLTAGTWIPVANIIAGQLIFKGASSQTSGYNKSNPYKVKDSQGNESIV